MKIRKISVLLLAVICCLLFVSCKSEGEDDSSSSSSPDPAVSPVLCVPELVIEASEIDEGVATLYLDGDYFFRCAFYDDKGERTEKEENVQWSSLHESVLTVTGGALKLKSEGESKVVAKASVNGEAYEASVKVIVTDSSRIRPDFVSIDMFTGYKMDGSADTNIKEKQLGAKKWNSDADKAEVVKGSDINWTSQNPEIAQVNASGLVTAVKNGSTKITGTYEGCSFDVKVDVYTPIYSADDMDKLSLITYNESKEKATELLGYNYMLMNDIDYSKHVRQIILPIASMTAGDYYQLAQKCGSSAGNASIFSYFWKDMLNLTESTDSDFVTRLYRDETKTKKFEGINPNAVHFTGILDGNGYSIKGSPDKPAWLLLENLLLQISADCYSAGAVSFMGYNDGIVRNLEFENVLIGASETYCRTDDNGERYYIHNPGWIKYYVLGDGSSLSQAQKNEVIASEKARRPMYYFYADKNFENSLGESAVFGEMQDWNARLCGGSAFFLQNNGLIENVCLKYRNVAYKGFGLKMGGLTVLNEGTAQNCYLELDLKDSGYGGSFRPEQPGCCVSVVNFGNLKNIYAVTKRITTDSDYAEIGTDNGRTSGVNTFATTGDFKDSSSTGVFDLSKWSFDVNISLKDDCKKIKG